VGEKAMENLNLQQLRQAVAGTAAAFRCVTEYQPVGGPGDKVFPPTYQRGPYAVEKRCLPGETEPVLCVLLDSVQSQANRMEMALLETWERKQIPLPVIAVDFADHSLPKVLRITSLEAPHRVADALLRDSFLDGKPFRKSDLGKRINDVDNRNATVLFELCPTTLVFGMWDSTGPKGGLGAKFARAMVSEIVGLHAEFGVKTSSRIDPAQIVTNAGPLYERDASDSGIDWTLEKDEAVRDKKGQPVLYNKGKDTRSKPGFPTKANHSNIPPTIDSDSGGVTIRKAIQTTVLSLPALRRLRFPLNGRSDPTIDNVARIALAALGLCAAALVREQGCDLRSRCQLHPTSPIVWELLDKPAEDPKTFSLSAEEAIEIYKAAVSEAKRTRLPLMDEELVLKPSPQLGTLIRRSQELAADLLVEEGEVQ
jgi:CRISPR-associated protein Csb1